MRGSETVFRGGSPRGVLPPSLFCPRFGVLLYYCNRSQIARFGVSLRRGESAINLNEYGKLCQTRPGVNLLSEASRRPPKLLVLGRLGVPKTLEMKGTILPKVILCDPADPHPNNPPEFIILELRTPRPATEPRDGPTRNFHEKYRKNTPGPEILDSQNLPPKYPENTEKNTPKIPKMRNFGIFSVFWGYFLGVPEFRAEGYFFGIFRGNSGSGHVGAL